MPTDDEEEGEASTRHWVGCQLKAAVSGTLDVLERQRREHAKRRDRQRAERAVYPRCADCGHLKTSHAGGGCKAFSPLWKRCECGMFVKIEKKCPMCGEDKQTAKP